MNKKNIIGYLLILLIVIVVLINLNILDFKNYKDYELSESELSKAEPISFNSKGENFCIDKSKEGFYDIKANGGSKEDKEYTKISFTNLKKGNFLNDVYLLEDQCLPIDGDVDFIPSDINEEKYSSEKFVINDTTDIIVGENIEPGTYEIEADIPKNTSVIVLSKEGNKINNEGISISLINSPGLDNSAYKNTKFIAKKNDVLSFKLIDDKEEVPSYASFPVTIKKID